MGNVYKKYMYFNTTTLEGRKKNHPMFASLEQVAKNTIATNAE